MAFMLSITVGGYFGALFILGRQATRYSTGDAATRADDCYRASARLQLAFSAAARAPRSEPAAARARPPVASRHIRV
jgi:hypothetical protein